MKSELISWLFVGRLWTYIEPTAMCCMTSPLQFKTTIWIFVNTFSELYWYVPGKENNPHCWNKTWRRHNAGQRVLQLSGKWQLGLFSRCSHVAAHWGNVVPGTQAALKDCLRFILTCIAKTIWSDWIKKNRRPSTRKVTVQAHLCKLEVFAS